MDTALKTVHRGWGFQNGSLRSWVNPLPSKTTAELVKIIKQNTTESFEIPGNCYKGIESKGGILYKETYILGRTTE